MVKRSAILSATAAFTMMSAIGTAAAGSMPIAGPTSPPIGHVQFCQLNPTDCGSYQTPPQLVRLDESAWQRLRGTNTGINAAIIPATDMQIFGVVERWSYPRLAGDCEDYVLEKRRALIADGWPASALLITVVRDEVGEGHAVLTVRTDRGDLVLDNKTDEIRVWSRTPYAYVKRQSATHAAAWEAVEIGPASEVGSLR